MLRIQEEGAGNLRAEEGAFAPRSTGRLDNVPGVSTSRKPLRATLRNLWITNTCAAPPEHSRTSDPRTSSTVRRWLESHCFGTPARQLHPGGFPLLLMG